LTDSPSIETQHGHPGIVLATLSLANVMALLDLFVVNVALHDIGAGLHYQSSLSDVAWVLNAYALFFGALLIPAGRFADKYGRKATFILGLAVFTVASLACAVSPDLWVLVGFRCVQAAGAAMIIPASLGLVRHDRTTRMPDLLGSLMIVVTIGAISLGLLNGPNWGWGSAKIIGSWAAAVAAAVAFLVSTRRAAVPVIDLKMFRSRVFSASNIAIVIAAAILGMQLLGLSLFLQQSWHWSTITTGLALAPGPAAVLGASLIAPRLHQQFPIGAVVASGFVLTAAGQALMILTLRHGVHNYAAAILPGWAVIGFGLGFTVPTIIGSATVDLPPEQSATGSAVVNSGRQFGGVFGASILVVVLGKAEVTGDPSRFYELWWVAVALCAAAVVVSLGLTPKRQPAKADVTVPVVASATDSTNSSVA
jgi:MFS family permease